MDKTVNLDNVVKFVGGTTAAITAASPGSTSRNQKILIASIAVGIALATALATYLRRPKNKTHPSLVSSSRNGRKSRGKLVDDGLAKSIDSTNVYDLEQCDVNGSVASTSRSRKETAKSNNARSTTTMSVASSRHTDSTLVSNSIYDNNGQIQLNCTQMGLLGIESLGKCIRYWEDSVAILRSSTECLPEDDQTNPGGTLEHLEKILESAHQLQKLTEDLFLDENSALYEGSEHGGMNRLKSASSMDSFMSAEDFLSDDEDIQQSLQSVGFSLDTNVNYSFPLYEAARRLVEAGTVPYRSLKTDMVGCNSDQEYLAKLHCLRGAFSRLIADMEKRHWIAENGKEVLKEIMLRADKDPTDFEQTFDNFVAWSQEPGNWVLTESELKDRGLRALTFYDIVLDFIFLDAFEDLEAPPASVLAVTQNRWLSNSFKETALCTAVWSVLKTKRRWLRYKDGFIAHFYDLSEHLMPTLAWGFLGPHTELQDLCIFFKEKFMDFLQAIFSFDRVRYTTLDELSADVMKRMEEMHKVVMERLQFEPDE